MPINSINPYNNTMRIVGLATGLDTDQIVSDLMRAERIPLDRLYQKKQIAEWRRDDYRDITSLLKGFESEFFDVLNPMSDMRSQSVYQKYMAVSSDDTIVTVVGGAGVTSLNHEITIDTIATAASAESMGSISKTLEGTSIASFEVNDYNNSFNLTYNGVKKTITLPNGTYADAAAIVGNGSDGLLKQLVSEAFSDVDVSVNGSSIQFTSANASDLITVSSNLASDNFLSVLNVNSVGTGSEITFPADVAGGRKFSVSIVEGGVTTTKEMEWASDTTYNDSVTLAADLQNMIDAAFGADKITVDGSNNKLSFTEGTGVESLSLSNSSNNNRVLQNLGFESNDSNKLSLSDTMEEVSSKLAAGNLTFDAADNFTLTINGTDIVINKSDTLKTMLNKVNTSDAGVKMSYSTYTDKFTIVSNETGEETITLDGNGSNFFTNTQLTSVTAGTNASFTLDGMGGTRSTNTFIIDGVTYTLHAADPGVQKTISLSQDVDETFDTIKSFVDKYNEVIDIINKKLNEEYNRSYLPLTDEQKEAMSESEIEKWEEMASSGLLRNDSILSRIVSDMRKALYDTISDVSEGLHSIGITTGHYSERGKLIIDEAKLRGAIQNSPDTVMDIFAKESTIRYSPSLSSQDRQTRYSENGIVNRLYDILQDNIRTGRDANGYKGVLLEKAGISGDVSEFRNLINEEIDRYDQRIDRMAQLLWAKEQRYYAQFAALERAMQQMNAQSNWLMSQLGMGQ